MQTAKLNIKEIETLKEELQSKTGIIDLLNEKYSSAETKLLNIKQEYSDLLEKVCLSFF